MGAIVSTEAPEFEFVAISDTQPEEKRAVYNIYLDGEMVAQSDAEIEDVKAKIHEVARERLQKVRGEPPWGPYRYDILTSKDGMTAYIVRRITDVALAYDVCIHTINVTLSV